MDSFMPTLELLKELYPVFCLPIIVFLLFLLVLSRLKRRKIAEEFENEKRELEAVARDSERYYKDEITALGRDKNQALLGVDSLARELQKARIQSREQEIRLGQAIKDNKQLSFEAENLRQEKNQFLVQYQNSIDAVRKEVSFLTEQNMLLK